MALAERVADRETTKTRGIAKYRDRAALCSRWPRRALRGRIEMAGMFHPAELRQQFFASHAAVGRAAGNPCERGARARDGCKPPSGRVALAKFQAIGNEGRNTKMICKPP